MFAKTQQNVILKAFLSTLIVFLGFRMYIYVRDFYHAIQGLLWLLTAGR